MILHLKEKNIYICAHNARFDIKMLEKEGIQNSLKVIDSLKVAKILYPTLSKYSLQILRFYFRTDKFEEGLESLQAHDALGDVIMLKSFLNNKIFKDVMDLDEYPGIPNWKDITSKYERCHLLTNIKPAVNRFSFWKI